MSSIHCQIIYTVNYDTKILAGAKANTKLVKQSTLPEGQLTVMS